MDGAPDDAGKAPEKRVSFVGNPAADDVVPPAEDPMKRLPTLRFVGHSVLTMAKGCSQSAPGGSLFLFSPVLQSPVLPHTAPSVLRSRGLMTPSLMPRGRPPRHNHSPLLLHLPLRHDPNWLPGLPRVLPKRRRKPVLVSVNSHTPSWGEGSEPSLSSLISPITAPQCPLILLAAPLSVTIAPPSPTTQPRRWATRPTF